MRLFAQHSLTGAAVAVSTVRVYDQRKGNTGKEVTKSVLSKALSRPASGITVKVPPSTASLARRCLTLREVVMLSRVDYSGGLSGAAQRCVLE